MITNELSTYSMAFIINLIKLIFSVAYNLFTSLLVQSFKVQRCTRVTENVQCVGTF